MRTAAREVGILGLTLMTAVAGTARGAEGGLTAVPGIRVGHHTLEARPTGCTVVLAEGGAVAAVDVRGPAPATRETDLLDPSRTIRQAHAIVLSGGSAFGLDTASGVMRFLEERGVGFDTGVAKVPIVPAAALFDLAVGSRPDVRPDADCGYRAAAAATSAPPAEGSVGAGAGATVGKLRGAARAMKGGLGTVALRAGDGLVVAALVAVNAVGDVVDPADGSLLAGVRSADGTRVEGARDALVGAPASAGQNTTIGVIATNAALTQAEAKQVAATAHDGLARAVRPAHTPMDGDALFVLATGDHEVAGPLAVGEMAAEAVARAIVRAVRQATSVPGYPALRDLAEE
ncbi:MAG: P1 family peptidase [Thermoanaerobaculia bacterium]|nr:P1 family peptidase [Thermoanaerobaculia bacterium]